MGTVVGGVVGAIVLVCVLIIALASFRRASWALGILTSQHALMWLTYTLGGLARGWPGEVELAWLHSLGSTAAIMTMMSLLHQRGSKLRLGWPASAALTVIAMLINMYYLSLVHSGDVVVTLVMPVVGIEICVLGWLAFRREDQLAGRLESNWQTINR